MQKYWPANLVLWSLRYLLKKHDGRETISSADAPTHDTYWVYLVETVSEEEKTIRRDIEADFEAEIIGPEKHRKLLLDSVKGKKVYVRPLKESENAPDKPSFELTPEMVKRFTFEIRHFYKETESEYDNPVWAALERLTKWTYLNLLKFRYKRWSANKNIAMLENRIIVLEKIIELEDVDRIKGASAHYLATQIYGPIFSEAGGKRKVQVFSRVNRIIESLLHTEELEKNGDSYKATGKALATLFNYKEQIQRHREAKRRDQLMLAATIVIAFSAAFQAGYMLQDWPSFTDTASRFWWQFIHSLQILLT